MKITLDYNIVTAEDRCIVVNEMDLANATDRDLEKVANYILYGKTAKGNALPEAKQINTKHATWKKKSPESLDALMESLAFDESSVKNFSQRSPYTNPKPKIDKVADADIPGMTDLWKVIDQTAFDLENEETLHGKTLRGYYLRHLLIDLRKEQYHLKEIFKPVIHFNACLDSEPQQIDWSCDTGYAMEPLTVRLADGKIVYDGPEDWTWREVAKHDVDLTDPKHIYAILDNYSLLKAAVAETPYSHTTYLLKAVELLIDKAHLSPTRMHILIRKIDHAPNDIIVKELQENYGVSYAINYISTIWTKEICPQIAEAGTIDRDEMIAANDAKRWKVCTKCHTRKLRDSRFFPKKRNTYDQLAPVCRQCQKKVTNK